MNIRVAHPGDADQIAAFWNPIIRTSGVTFNSRENSPADIAKMIGDTHAAGHGFFCGDAG